MRGFTWFTVRDRVLLGEGAGEGDSAVSCSINASWRGWLCYLMIWGQSLQALAFRLASASQAGSVDTPGESLEGKRFDKSLTAGGDGVESAISTGIQKKRYRLQLSNFSTTKWLVRLFIQLQYKGLVWWLFLTSSGDLYLLFYFDQQ